MYITFFVCANGTFSKIHYNTLNGKLFTIPIMLNIVHKIQSMWKIKINFFQIRKNAHHFFLNLSSYVCPFVGGAAYQKPIKVAGYSFGLCHARFNKFHKIAHNQKYRKISEKKSFKMYLCVWK